MVYVLRVRHGLEREIKVIDRKEGLEFRLSVPMKRLSECGSLTVVSAFAKQREG